jgi:hypothetical protein
MAEVQDLEIDLSNTVGWDKSGGKSQNVWGQVPMLEVFIKWANKLKAKSRGFFGVAKKEIKKPPVWTSVDGVLYADDKPITKADLPKTISATFKTCDSKYDAIVENMAMQIACALDLPTSYNYIVKWNPNDFPKIVENYPNFQLRRDVRERGVQLGIVSVDFLQSYRDKISVKKEVETQTTKDGKEIEFERIDDFAGDRLIAFDDIVTKIVGSNRLSGDQNLIENWVKAVDKFVQDELGDLPREKVNKIINNVHSRIARSFLLKEYCGDCDNTSYNAAIVYNESNGTLRYAPNHDFGDSFNKLRKTKINRPKLMAKEEIEKSFQYIQDEKMKEYAIQTMLKRLEKENAESVADIARQYAVVESSKRNVEYILNNFPESAREFFENVDKCVQKKTFDKIVDSYTRLTCNGEQLLTKTEAEIFKEYLAERSVWMSELYVEYLRSKGEIVPEPVAEEDDYQL